MVFHPFYRCFPVVGVDLQCGIHPHRKPLLRRMQRFSRRITASVTDHRHSLPEGVDGVRDQHNVLIPAHQLSLSSRTPNDEPLQAPVTNP